MMGKDVTIIDDGHRFTKKQSMFIEAVARGLKPWQAAKYADYSDPVRTGWTLIRDARLLQAIKTRRESVIHGTLAQQALSTLEELMIDKSTPAPTRFNASKLVLELAGHHPEAENLPMDKPLEDMNPSELAGAISSGMQALAELAKDLDGSHIIDGQVVPVKNIGELEVLENDPEIDDLLN